MMSWFARLAAVFGVLGLGLAACDDGTGGLAVVGDGGTCPWSVSGAANKTCTMTGEQCTSRALDNVPCAPCSGDCIVTWTCNGSGEWVITACTQSY